MKAQKVKMKMFNSMLYDAIDEQIENCNSCAEVSFERFVEGVLKHLKMKDNKMKNDKYQYPVFECVYRRKCWVVRLWKKVVKNIKKRMYK